MSALLILYSTVDGQTRAICEHIGLMLEAEGHGVVVARIEDADGVDPAAYDGVIIGASIRYGRHRPSVAEFVATRRSALESRPTAFFSVNIVARKPGKDCPETNPYLRAFLRRTRWRPRLLEVFAGRLDYPRCRPLDRLMIRCIMRLTGGPTDPAAVVEFTDWTRVDAFARKVAAMQADTPAAT